MVVKVVSYESQLYGNVYWRGIHWVTNVLLSCRSSEARQQTKRGFNFYYRLFDENFDPFNGHGYSREMLTCAAVSRDAPLIDS